jgi:hypothetical protein
MQRLEVSCAVRHIYGSLGAKGLQPKRNKKQPCTVIQCVSLMALIVLPAVISKITHFLSKPFTSYTFVSHFNPTRLYLHSTEFSDRNLKCNVTSSNAKHLTCWLIHSDLWTLLYPEIWCRLVGDKYTSCLHLQRGIPMQQRSSETFVLPSETTLRHPITIVYTFAVTKFSDPLCLTLSLLMSYICSSL